MRKLAILATTVLMSGGMLLAQAPASSSGTDTGAANKPSAVKSSAKADHTFAMKAAQGGMAEVELGKLATEKASNPDVKAFGQKMVDDHTKANDQLKDIASKQSLALPTDVSAKDKAEKDRLSKLSGDAFDKAYMSHMVMDHKKDVADFQKEAKSGGDDQIKNFAQQTLPTLQEHLKMAQATQSKVKGSGSASKAKGSNSADASAH